MAQLYHRWHSDGRRKDGSSVGDKDFSSKKNLEKDIIIVNGEPSINPISRVYYQVKVAAEIIDVPYIVLLYEFGSIVSKITIKRDLDFIWHHFDHLRRIYLKHIVPFNLYGIPKPNKKSQSFAQEYFSEKIYDELLQFLIKHEDKYNEDSDSNRFLYYGEITPSDANNTYFELFSYEDTYKRLLNEPLKNNKLIV